MDIEYTNRVEPVDDQTAVVVTRRKRRSGRRKAAPPPAPSQRLRPGVRYNYVSAPHGDYALSADGGHRVKFASADEAIAAIHRNG